MKRVLSLFIFVVVVSAHLSAQMGAGSVEFSVSGTGGWMKNKVEFPGEEPQEGRLQSYAIVSIRPGVYLTSFMQLEPEFLFTAAKYEAPSFSVGGNLLFEVPPAGERRVSPFVLAGYGVSNSIPVARMLFSRASDKLDIELLQAGGGLKIFATPSIAFRLEYRFQQYKREIDLSTYWPWSTMPFSEKLKETYTFNLIFFGTSIFFGGE